MCSAAAAVIDPDSADFYIRSMTLVRDASIPFLVGGAYALARYTGIERNTKDFDLFIRRGDYERVAAAIEKAGYATELSFPHWLGKILHGGDTVDLIFSSGNGVAEVDDLWFRFGVEDKVLGMDVRLIPAEEMIWSKGMVMERERFDGADVAHIIKNVGHELDWRRLIFRYGDYWRVLYAHLILYGFIYPSRRSNVPHWVMEELAHRTKREIQQPDWDEKVCFGTILSRQQYLADVRDWAFKDPRQKPFGGMTDEEIEQWTAGIEVDGKS